VPTENSIKTKVVVRRNSQIMTPYNTLVAYSISNTHTTHLVGPTYNPTNYDQNIRLTKIRKKKYV